MKFIRDYFWETGFVVVFSLVVVWCIPEFLQHGHMVRFAIEWVAPTAFDPPYQNVKNIVAGMKRTEVHGLLGAPTPIYGAYSVIGNGQLSEEWSGTGGTISVSYESRGVDEMKEWIVLRKAVVPPPNNNVE